MPSEQKPALSFIDQLTLMKERGLIVTDNTYSINILRRVNYYKLSGYSLHLKNGEDYLPDTTFEKIYNTYLFDKKLGALITSLTESIENHFKTSFANILSLKYGATPHTVDTIFFNQKHFNNFLAIYEDEKTKHKNTQFIQHNLDKYGELPIWVAIEILSFGTISLLYKNLKNSSDRKNISIEFFDQLGIFVKPYHLENWLHAICTLRNRCAHHSRLYNRTIPSTVKLLNTYITDSATLSLESIDPNSIFAAFLVMRKMISKESHWAETMKNLFALIEEYSGCIELEKMGFPINWEEYLV